jgi:hypothetical protein
MRISILVVAVSLGPSWLGAQTAPRSYYVDCSAGADSRDGRSEGAAWRSLAKVSATTFLPGDAVSFRRGCTWQGMLTIGSSGDATQPIVFQAYGTGEAPRISNPGVSFGHAIHVVGDHVVIQDFNLTDAHEAGLFFAPGSDHNVARNNEISACGTGIMCRGQGNLITHNLVHDLTMIVNDSAEDNDYGAVAFWFYEGHNEVSYNRAVNCSAPSHDYGTDGGFVEVFDQGDGLYVHHNWAYHTDGFFELGAGRQGASARNVVVAYNVMWGSTSGAMVCLHDNGAFSISIADFAFENNTVVHTSKGYRVFGCLAEPSVLRLRNNIFYSSITIGDGAPGVHENNLYSMTGGASIGYALNASELTGDPLFADLASGDFHLRSESPAISAGAVLGYRTDIDGHPVPLESAPDMGAYEVDPGPPSRTPASPRAP